MVTRDFPFGAAAVLIALYLTVYGVLRWNGELVYGVKYGFALRDRRDCSTVEVVANRNDQKSGLRWEDRDLIGRCVELGFFPLCQVEASVRQMLGRAGFGYPQSSIEYIITSVDEELCISLPER